MAKKIKKIDKKQIQLPFSSRVEKHLKEKENILDAISNPEPVVKQVESFDEACVELAAAVKNAVRKSGMSRDEIVDGINLYFGWSEEGKGRSLSIHMFNHYLSKPSKYPIPGALIYAIQHITGCLEPCRSFARLEGGDVISKNEKDELLFGKADALAFEVGKIKKQLRKRMSQY